jgi:SAM-dependent methyltransferase
MCSLRDREDRKAGFPREIGGNRMVDGIKSVDQKEDKHFHLFVHDNLFRRLLVSPKEFNSYVSAGQTVADLGCGPGYFTLALAERVGTDGKVYAVDSDQKAIHALEKKVNKRGYRNVEMHVSSAHDLNFIEDGSVDFVLANGLLCSVAPQQRESTVSELKRILKQNGKAYLSAGKGFGSYMTKAGWEKILEAFEVEQRGSDYSFELSNRWALVSRIRGEGGDIQHGKPFRTSAVQEP